MAAVTSTEGASSYRPKNAQAANNRRRGADGRSWVETTSGGDSEGTPTLAEENPETTVSRTADDQDVELQSTMTTSVASRAVTRRSSGE